MAKAKKLPSGSWRCRAYLGEDANGKKIMKSFTAPTKKEAEFLASQYLIENHSEGEDQTFLQVYNKMIELKRPAISPGTYREFVRDIQNDYYDMIKNIPVKKIDNALVQKMINAWITKGLSPKTISNKYVNFRSAMRTVYKNIEYDVIRPEKEPANIYIPTDEEVKILINASKNTPVEVAILLGAYMGMREAEIAALRWDNVDLQKRLMTVSEATSIDVDNNTVINKPKSDSGNRTLPIPEIVCEALQRHRNDDKELVVPLSCAAIYKRFKRILHSTGIHDFRFHDLRHYYASVMLSLSVPDKYAMERMGHSTNSTLKNVYQHTMKNKQDEISAQLDAYFSSPTNEK